MQIIRLLIAISADADWRIGQKGVPRHITHHAAVGVVFPHRTASDFLPLGAGANDENAFFDFRQKALDMRRLMKLSSSDD